MKETNKRLSETRDQLPREKYEIYANRLCDTDETELKAFIGLAYIRGLLNQGQHNARSLQRSNRTSRFFSNNVSCTVPSFTRHDHLRRQGHTRGTIQKRSIRSI